MRGQNRTLTAVSGLRVGHATAPGGGSGCTVVLGPFRAAVEVRGMATGSRELGVLAPEHLVPRVDALLLTGGSAFGLAAADGVTAWLAARGIGYETGVAPVPIVPAAVIYDLAEGRERPGPETGREACEAAGDGPVEGGTVGAGTGALVGKLAGRERASPGGVGTAALEAGGWTVAALAVVNALGNVVDGRGRVVAGVRDGQDGFMDAADLLLDGSPAGEMAEMSRPGRAGGSPPAGPRAGTHTTLAVVATDAPLGRLDLARLARMASTAMARRIDPVHTPFDGDVVFALSTGDEAPATSGPLMALGVAARTALEDAIVAAVQGGDGPRRHPRGGE